MNISARISRSLGSSCVLSLLDALKQGNWRTHQALAMRLILRAGDLSAKELTGLELDVTVYALDSTTQCGLLRFRFFIRHSRWPPHHHNGSPAMDNNSSKTCRPCYPEN